MAIRLLAGETKAKRKAEYLKYMSICRVQIVYFKSLYVKYYDDRDKINNILRHLSSELLQTISALRELERLK
jgi:hypothetical protein